MNGIYDIPEWFKIVNDVDRNIFSFEVPQIIMGRDLKGLTICFVCFKRPFYWRYLEFKDSQESHIGIIVRNLTKQTALHAKVAFAFLKRMREYRHLWQGQLSNDVLRLQGGDQVSILVRPSSDFLIVTKTGVHLEWDKVMKENMDNMDNPDPYLYDLETNRDFSAGFFGHDAFVRSNQSSVVDEQLAVEGCFGHLKSFLSNIFFNCFSHPR